jgi:hypothetical protein
LAGLNANGSNLELTLGRFWQKYAAIRQTLRPVQVGRGDCITMVVTFASPNLGVRCEQKKTQNTQAHGLNQLRVSHAAPLEECWGMRDFFNLNKNSAAAAKIKATNAAHLYFKNDTESM